MRRFAFLLSTLLLAALGCSGEKPMIPLNLFSQSKGYVKNSWNWDIVNYNLDNGMKVILLHAPQAPFSTYYQCYRVGSGDEKPHLTGIAHFFEHLMFKGTTKYPGDRYEKELDALGIYNNAFTSFDMTCYIHKDIPAENLEKIIDIESDRMVNLKLTDNDIDTERDVVKEEMRIADNKPQSKVFWDTMKMTFSPVKDHPYSWRILGDMEHLNAAKRVELLDFYKTFYSPNNSTVVAAGNFDMEQVESLIRKYYSKLKPQVLPKRQTTPLPEQKAANKKQVDWPGLGAPLLYVFYPTPPATHEDSWALEVLENILTQGEISRLSKSMERSKNPVAESVSAYHMGLVREGVFVFDISPFPGKIDECLEILNKEVKKLQTTLVSDKELDRGKAWIRKSFVMDLQAASRKAGLLARIDMGLGDFSKLFDSLDKYAAVTASDIMRVAKKYLKPEFRNISYAPVTSSLNSSNKADKKEKAQ